jgi:hypothetical protein
MGVSAELLKIARLLVADEYPITYGSEQRQQKTRVAIDELRQGVANKFIPNARFKEANEILPRRLEGSFNDLVEKWPGGLGRAVFLYTNTLFVRFSDLPKVIANLERGLTAKSFSWAEHETLPREMTPELREVFEFAVKMLKSWLPVPALIKEAKQYVKKAGEVRELQKQQEAEKLQKRLSQGSMKVVTDTLNGVLENIRPHFIKDTKDWLLGQADKFIKSLENPTWLKELNEQIDKQYTDKGRKPPEPSKFSLWNFAAHYRLKNIYKQLDEMVEVRYDSDRFDRNVVGLELKPGADAVAQKFAEVEYAGVSENYSTKNIGKLLEIVSNKDKGGAGISEVKTQKINYRAGSFESIVHFEFTDGTMFTVKNKVVRNARYSDGGYNFFYQYPTTFHDVRFLDGKVKSMVPEAAMVNGWSRENPMAPSVAAELVRVARLLAFVPQGEYRDRRAIEKSGRLLRMVLRKLELPVAASVVNDLGQLGRGRGDVHKLNRDVLDAFNDFRGWGAGDFAALYSEVARSKAAKVEDVVRRIQNAPLAPQDKAEMLRHPQDLSLSESGRLYRRVDFDTEEQMFPGRRCRVDWKNHAKYRSELRDVNPQEISREVCNFIKERYFDPKNPRREQPKPDNTRLKLPEGVAVVEYDARKDPVPVEMITTWASKMANRVALAALGL